MAFIISAPTDRTRSRAGLTFSSPSSPDLKTSAGLVETARQTGFAEQAADILARTAGEDPRRIFSGGPVQDIFDSLNALQYGVTGVLKGKGFAEGVRTRQSFSDQDALGEYGLPGVIAGVALDIAVDPLTYLPVGGTGKSLLGGVRKVRAAIGAGVTAAAETSRVARSAKRVGDFFGQKLIYGYGLPQPFRETFDRSLRAVAIGQQNVMDLAKPLLALSPETQRAFLTRNASGQLVRRSADELRRILSPADLDAALPAFKELDRLGRESVANGLLKPEVYERNVGEYIANLYRHHEIGKQTFGLMAGKRPLRINLDRFKHRKDLAPDVREALGEILEAGYPTAKAMVQLVRANEMAKLFKFTAEKFGSDVGLPGLTLVGKVDNRALGALAGKYVPEPIALYINELVRKPEPTLGRKLVAGFKFGKVIANPATHVRNMLSNFILNHFEGLNPARLDVYATAAHQLATKGRWYQEARAVGLGLDTFAAAELRSLLNGQEMNRVGGAFRKAIDKVSNIYQKEEEWAKLSQYIFQRGKGLSPDDAWKISERATFNYTQVTPFIRKVRESVFGFPFITFSYKATGQVGRTLLTKPTAISNIGKIKSAIESLSPVAELKAERENEPDYIRNGFFIRLPQKDRFGRAAYFDMTYMLPFGDVFTGEFFTAEKRGATVAQTALTKFPALNVIAELARNQDFFGKPIIPATATEPQQIGGAIMKYLTKFYAPPLAFEFPEKLLKSIEGELRSELEPEFRGRTVKQQISAGIFGLKRTPIRLELARNRREIELRQQLQRLLVEARIIRQVEIPFIPKTPNTMRPLSISPR